jgi:hypothetical protein
MRAKFFEPTRNYVIDIQLVGDHRCARLELAYDEPPLRVLDIEANVFVSEEEGHEPSSDDAPGVVVPLRRPARDPSSEAACAAYRRALELEMSERFDERMRYVGALDAMTFPILTGIHLDDCDAHSQGALDAASQLFDDSGELFRHVATLLDENDRRARLVLNVWEATLPQEHLEALPLALRALYLRFGHPLLAFSGSHEMGTYLETRNAFRRVRQPINELRAWAAKSVKADIARGAYVPEQERDVTAKTIEHQIEWQERAAIWIA